jgi:hypothetical protein
MMRSTRRWLAAGLLVAGLAGLVAGQPAVGDDPKGSKITIGLTDTLFRDNPEARSEKAARPFKSLLESQTGLSGEVVPNLKPDDLARQLKDGSWPSSRASSSPGPGRKTPTSSPS